MITFGAMELAFISDNVRQVERRIQQACARVGRDRREVQLMAVSKTFPREYVEAAMAAGIRVFGENRVQEAEKKFGGIQSVFPDSGAVENPTARASTDGVDSAPQTEFQIKEAVKLHLIGHLQSNKARRAAEIFDMIQTIDRLELAQKLNDHCERLNRLLPILIQVNLGNEETKSGVEPSGALELVRQIAPLSHLRIRGLMAIPPFRERAEDSREDFRSLSCLAKEIGQARIERVSVNELSMGMSQDFEVAIEEGATLVRVGTGIFGARQT